MIFVKKLEYSDELTFGLETAQAAGRILMNYFGKYELVQTKSSDGWSAAAIAADLESDIFIVNEIKKHYPGHQILTEESTHPSNSEYTWRVDSPDGSNNLKRGHPEFSVAISLEKNGVLVLGIVHKPFYNETFYAVKNQGAWTNRGSKNFYRINVSNESTLDQAVVTFNADLLSPRYIENGKKILTAFSKVSPGIRFRTRESSSIDLAEVASGTSTAHIGLGTKPWDYAAGTLIIREAGGKVTNLNGEDVQPSTGVSDIIATNSKVHENVLKILQSD